MAVVSENATLRIGLAAVPNLVSVEARLQTVIQYIDNAGAQNVAIVCFPEAYLPGLRGEDFEVAPPDQDRQQAMLEEVREAAQRNRVAVVLGMEWESTCGMHNVAFVISRRGEIMGYQAKNQLAPQEEAFYVPDGHRHMYEVDGIPFGMAICHEGWRYPETVRWAARRGARVVFHPHFTGSDKTGVTLSRWGDPESPYYEKAMIARGVENSIYFASVNCATRFQESATTLIGPDGDCVAHVPYGEAQLLVQDLDLTRATGFYAQRFNSEWYR